MNKAKICWQLWRQDDNGIRFLAGEFATRESAESRLAGLTRSPHKQIYWICDCRGSGKTTIPCR